MTSKIKIQEKPIIVGIYNDGKQVIDIYREVYEVVPQHKLELNIYPNGIPKKITVIIPQYLHYIGSYLYKQSERYNIKHINNNDLPSIGVFSDIPGVRGWQPAYFHNNISSTGYDGSLSNDIGYKLPDSLYINNYEPHSYSHKGFLLPS